MSGSFLKGQTEWEYGASLLILHDVALPGTMWFRHAEHSRTGASEIGGLTSWSWGWVIGTAPDSTSPLFLGFCRFRVVSAATELLPRPWLSYQRTGLAKDGARGWR